MKNQGGTEGETDKNEQMENKSMNGAHHECNHGRNMNCGHAGGHEFHQRC